MWYTHRYWRGPLHYLWYTHSSIYGGTPILHAVHCGADTLASLFYHADTVQCTAYSIQYTAYTTEGTVYSVRHTVYSVPAGYTAEDTVCVVQFTVYAVHCTPYTTEGTVYTVYCTVYGVHCIWYIVPGRDDAISQM